MPTTEQNEETPVLCSICEQEEEDGCCCWTCPDCDIKKSEDDICCSNCHECENCCSCWSCDGCERMRGEDHSQCGTCEQCEGCCGCYFCEGCHERVRELCCGSCEMCENCGCGCESGNVRFESQPLTFYPAKKFQYKSNPSARFIGAEIEVAACTEEDNNINKVCDRWSAPIVEDGSLPTGGFEICTSPASGDEYTRQIEQIGKAIEEAGGAVNRTCGMHVHIDARDFSYYDLRRLIKLYARIEDHLFLLVPHWRRNSTYCTPCGELYEDAVLAGNMPKDSKKNITKALYDKTDTRGKRDHKYHSARYSALNIHSWFYRGTIECRLFPGTVNVLNIQQWGILWALILDYAYGQTERGIDEGLTGWPLLLAIASRKEGLREWVEARRAKCSNKTEQGG